MSPRGQSSKICISISGRTLASLRSKILIARKYRSALIEFRLDFVRDLDIYKLQHVRSLLEGNEIITIRSKQEGGHLAIDEKRRVELIRYAISHLRPQLFDVEIRTLRNHPVLVKDLEMTKTKFIASFHDLEGTKNTAYLRRVIMSAPLSSKSLFAVKIATKANSVKDNLKVLALYSKNSKQEFPKKLVAFCTGKIGIGSRILSLFLGGPYCYASLAGEPVALGQLDYEKMAKITGKR
jgi:3-dehydroquinate dehydratase type I